MILDGSTQENKDFVAGFSEFQLFFEVINGKLQPAASRLSRDAVLAVWTTEPERTFTTPP